MTDRKPPGVSWESWIDTLIRQARERGEFDNLAYHGKPLPDLEGPHDPERWVKGLLQREGVSYLPPTLQIRKDAEDAVVEMAKAPTEAVARAILEDINERIRRINRYASEGPPTTLAPFDVDAMLARWRTARAGDDAAG